MAETLAWFFLVCFLLACLWGWDRALALKDVEKDLKAYLGDTLVARDLADPKVRVHYAAVVSQLKQLIRNHFKL